MNTLVIKDFDTAIDAYIAAWAKDFDVQSLEFSPEANISIKLEGEQWDGRIDYKMAEFVIRLQRALLNIYNEQAEQKIRYNTRPLDKDGLRITITVEKGCSLLNVDLKGWWDGMESKDKRFTIIATALILTVGAALVFWHGQKTSAATALEITRIEAQKEIELKIQERLQDEADRKEASQLVDKVFKLTEQANAHMYFLASKMQPEDKMTVGDITISAPEAKQIFRSTSQIESLGDEAQYFLDGDYVVTSINREKEEVDIKFPDKKRKFSLVWLEGHELEIFYKQCAQHKTNESLPPIPMQVTAYFRGGVFQRGFVQGTGPKRETSRTFSEAALDSASIQEEKNAEIDGLE